jgi:hypothetical protein
MMTVRTAAAFAVACAAALALTGCGGMAGGGSGQDGGAARPRPARRYISRDPAVCRVTLFSCEKGSPFFDRTGCGCEGIRCGRALCGVGEFCCNESCSICAPAGGVCTQMFCGPTE